MFHSMFHMSHYIGNLKYELITFNSDLGVDTNMHVCTMGTSQTEYRFDSLRGLELATTWMMVTPRN